MIQSNTTAAKCLIVDLLSFSVPRDIILGTDEVIVKAKTLPDENKQKCDIKGKKMGNCNLTFRLNITSQTQKLTFAFRKKTFLSGNHTIGTSEVDISDLLKSISGNSPSGTKTLNIYYPVKRQLYTQQPRGFDRSSIKEKVIGKMKFTISLSEPIPMEQDSKKQKRNGIKNSSKSRNGSHSKNLI